MKNTPTIEFTSTLTPQQLPYTIMNAYYSNKRTKLFGDNINKDTDEDEDEDSIIHRFSANNYNVSKCNNHQKPSFNRNKYNAKELFSNNIQQQTSTDNFYL